MTNFNFDIREGNEDGEIREKVKSGLRALGTAEASTLPYLLELLSVRDSGIDNTLMNPEAIPFYIEEFIKSLMDLEVIKKKDCFEN
jgi:hypothetical protein